MASGGLAPGGSLDRRPTVFLDTDEEDIQPVVAGEQEAVQLDDVEVGLDVEKGEEEKEGEAAEGEKEETMQDLIKEYFPWLIAAGVGFILLIVAVALLASAGSGPFVFPYEPKYFNIPNYQGSMRVYSVDDVPLKYINDLRFIGSRPATSLRYKLEPKLKYIYSNASLNVDSVVIISFKYGGAGETSVSQEGRAVLGRSTGENDDENESKLKKKALIIRHWIYLKDNVTMSLDALKTEVLSAIDKVDGIEIDKSSLDMRSLANMTRIQAIQLLTQAGFFKNGLAGLDLGLLDLFGIGLQSEGDEEGLCPSLKIPYRGDVSNRDCTTSVNTFVQMACKFSCDPGYDLIGSPVRVCLSSGLWSGEPVQCQKQCKPLKLLSTGIIQPPACREEGISTGQLCFLECPHGTHRMVFPPDISDAHKVAKRDMWPSIDYSKPEFERVEAFVDVRAYYRECNARGEWTGIDASCKALCPKLKPPTNGKISPDHCMVDPVEGESCTVSCDDGYVMVGGSSTRVTWCDVSGKWTGEVPVCKKLCPTLSEGSDFTITPKICVSAPDENTRCEYKCNDGYMLVGDSERTCIDGEWDIPAPTCISTCSPLTYPDHGMLISDGGPCNEKEMAEDTECNFVCDFGYVASEPSTICTSSAWSVAQAALVCRKTCGALDSDEYGSWDPPSCNFNHTSLLGTCDLTCGAGNTLVGESSLTCSEEGEWDNNPGACMRNCAALSAPTDGSLDSKPECSDGSATVGTKCKFSCNAGKKLDGERVLTCKSDGWSNAAPTCGNEDQYIVAQFFVDHFICMAVDKEGKLEKIDNVDDSCEEENARWVIDDDRIQNVVTRTCITANNVTTALQMDECDALNTYQNFESGITLYMKLISEERYVTAGYRTVKEPQMEPYPDSLFDPALKWGFYDSASGLSSTATNMVGIKNSGKCQPLSTLDDDVTVSPSSCTSGLQNPSQTCSLGCAAGKSLSDPSKSSVTCTGGVWDIDDDLYCASTSSSNCQSFSIDPDWEVDVTPIDCSTNQKAPGETCEFECKNTTTTALSGPASVMCLENGKWSPTLDPICRPRCPAMTMLPDHAYMITPEILKCMGVGGVDPEPGTLCSLACADGYEMIGHPMLTCGNDGQWNEERPVCIKTCGLIDKIEHASLTNCSEETHTDNKYLPGTLCDFTCDIGFYPGLTTRRMACQENGGWMIFDTNGRMECLPKCSPVVVTTNVTVTPLTCLTAPQTPGMECMFSCEYGYDFDISDSSIIEFNMLTRTSTVTRTCQEDKTWSGPIVYCNKRCPALPRIDSDNGGYYYPSSCNDYGVKPGTTCELHCQGDGAVYDGPDILTCDEDGEWFPANRTGTCSPACEALTRSPHSTILPHSCTEGFVQAGTKCTISCPNYMERIGSGFRECIGFVDSMTGSRWSGTPGTSYCVARCPPLTPSDGSFIFPSDCATRSRIDGDTCAFECNSGYSLFGSAALRCTASGTWSGAVPMCYRPCPPLTVEHGHIECKESDGFLSEGLGFVFGPGAKCFYYCDAGYTAYEQNEISCDKDGIWNPTPFCSPVSDTFPIIQKIGEKSVCLQASKLGLDGSKDDSEWHVTTTKNSTAGCEQAGNNAMWFWFNSFQIKHAETGLCLTAESALIDAAIILQKCDSSNLLQQWSCDAEHPYRFVLKGTILSIDTMYEDLGPVLQSWTHAQTYWVTYNSILESTGTVCSNKPVGACPAITKLAMKAVPNVCKTDSAIIWQKCAVSCEEGTHFDGPIDMVECQPTGEWENLDVVSCRRTCPPLPAKTHGNYDQDHCANSTTIHQQVCYFTCNGEYVLSNMQETAAFTCEDGEWYGDLGVTCQKQCPAVPASPENGRVDCIFKNCTVVCNTGYRTKTNETNFDCEENPDFVSDKNVTCVEEFQFRLQLQTAVFSDQLATCLAVVSNETIAKVRCDRFNIWQYWRWEDSVDVEDGDFSMIKSIPEGTCLTAESDEAYAEIRLAECNETDPLQQWTCHDPNHPGRFGLRAAADTYVDAGSIYAVTPPVLRKDNAGLQSADWIAVDFQDVTKYTCGSRALGSCPKLFVGPFTSLEPQGCADWDGLPADADCTSYCDANYEMKNGLEEHGITCEDTGKWSDDIELCVAKSSASGKCTPFTIVAGMKVSPAKCEEGEGEDILAGEKCSFSCEPGFYLDGQDDLICKSGVDWTATQPQCVAFCPGIKPETGVNMTTEACRNLIVPKGTLCEKECAEGFIAREDSPATVETVCNSGGTWSEPYFACEAQCVALSEPPFNATSVLADLRNKELYRNILTSSDCADNKSRPHTLCSFSCDDDYVLVGGTEKITCRIDGFWSQGFPRCVKKFFCPEVNETSSPLKAYYDPLIDGKAVFPGTAVKIECFDGHMPEGDDLRKCTEDGNWGGIGPNVPICVRKCEKLIPPFAVEIDPSRCVSGWVDEGLGCTYLCAEGTAMAEGVTSQRILCSDGEYSDPAPKCMVQDIKDIERLKVHSQDNGFLIITRSPANGCLYVATDKVVRWRPASECDPRQIANRWRWFDSQRLMSFEDELCMQAMFPANDTTKLIVGECTTEDIFGCGSPHGVYNKYTLYSYSSPQWRLGLLNDVYSGLPYEIMMIRAETNSSDIPINVYEGLEVYANVDVMNPRTTDRTVCSYMCGGPIHFDNNYQKHLITSPGFIHNQEYPANTHCEWIIHGHGRIINLLLREIDFDDDLKEDQCASDCVTITENDSSGSSVTEKIAIYSGNDIRDQHPTLIQSVASTVHVTFISNDVNEGRGFALQYQFTDLLPTQTECGLRKEYDQMLYDKGKSNDDPGLHGATTTINKWPWLVSIRENYIGSSKAYHRCTGALISKNVVITAAHCARFTLRATSMVDIGIGTTLQNDMDKNMRERNFYADPFFFVYHGYDDISRNGDIALWKLSAPVKFSETISPICLPDQGFKVHEPKQNCFSAGWNSLTQGVKINQIMEYELKMVSASWCKENLGLNPKATFVCGENVNFDITGLHDTTQSEPLMCRHNGNWYLSGVRSYTHIGTPESYRLYTDVASLYEWIEHTMDTMEFYYTTQGAHLLLGAQ